MKQATFIKNLDSFTGEAALYKLSEPAQYDKPSKKTKFVAVSATNAKFSGPETYIFPANEDGEVIAWGEMNGSYRGGLDHVEALNGLGYQVAEA